MLPELIAYSNQPNLKLSDFKKGNYDIQNLDQKLINYCQEHNILGISQKDSWYPAQLRNYSDSPYLFYYEGNLDLLKEKKLWIVWPRLPSSYALEVMELFFKSAEKYQIATISGFARGIDQLAHELSLKHKLPTIAVLGWGFQHYHKSKDRLFLEKILENWGLIISQFKIWFEPAKRSFPQRNKLLAQLADILFLPEAKEKSWSLITTDFANQYHKKVYSVPAQLFSSSSAGIFQKMTENKIELISDFDYHLSQHFQKKADFSPSCIPAATISELTPSQLKIYNHLNTTPASFEELLVSTQLEYSSLLQEITLLLLNSTIKETSPGYYFLQK